MHRGQNLGMLSHSKVIVAAPDSHRPLGSIRMRPGRMRELPLLADNVDKGAIPALVMEPLQRLIQLCRIIQTVFLTFVAFFLAEDGVLINILISEFVDIEQIDAFRVLFTGLTYCGGLTAKARNSCRPP